MFGVILLFSKEFELITKDISMNNEFMKLNSCIHHGISRLDHSYRVAYYSYKIMKFFKLNYFFTSKYTLYLSCIIL